MSAETTALLRSIRQWVMAIAFLLGVGVVTLAHVGYVQNLTRVTYVQSLVFSVAGALGGVVALVAGLKLLGRHASSGPDE